MTPEKRSAIVAAAQSWLATPFHHGARVKGVGVDCLQLLIGVYIDDLALSPPVDPGMYAWDWHMHNDEERYLSGISAHTRRTTDPQPGDIALFTFGKCVSHAAIVIDWPRVIHAYFRQGVVETDAESGAELAGRLHSFWTLAR